MILPSAVKLPTIAISAGAIDYYDAGIEPRTGDNFKVAEFRLWCPKDLGRPSGVLCVFTGFNGDGRKMAEDPGWQTFARKHHLALLAYHMVAIWPAGIIREHLEDHYTHVVRGSGAAFWLALQALGEKAGHPEIKDLPVALWGHSAGGQFAYSVACYYPERVIGFVSVKGGFYHSETSEKTRRLVPGLLIAGAKDEQFRQKAILDVFEADRARGALWCMAVEPDAGHGIEKSNGLALPYLSAIIGARLGPAYDGNLTPLKEQDGWLGDLDAGTVFPYGDYAADPLKAVWLPGQIVAEIWRAFVALQHPL